MKSAGVFLSSLLIPCAVDGFKGPITLPTTARAYEIDTDEVFAKSTFPIKPDDLIKRAHEVIGPDIQLGMKDGGNCLAEDFEFVAPVVGPLGREPFLEALAGFKLEDSFDITQNSFGWTVSPVQPYRVYYFTQQTAKHIADFIGAKPENTKEDLVLPPQCNHIDFNEKGQMKEFGFYTVDRRYGNTGGLGGAFAYFYGVGKPLPIPECQPYKPSKRFRALQLIGKIADRFKGKK